MRGPRLALALWLLGAATNSTAIAAPFEIQQVAAGVFVHFGRPLDLEAPGHDDIANIGFIVGSRCVAVIDTGGSVRIGRALLAAIRQRTQTPICYVINTHVHVDHVLGNAAFAASHASFIGHAALPDAIARSRLYFLQHYPEDLDSPATAQQIIAPDQRVQDSLELDLGGRHLQLRAWPVAHTDCDLTVLDESTLTLWTGDLLFRQRLPAVDGDVGGWLNVIDEMARLPVKRAIPGHGPLTNDLESAFAPERRYLRALLDGVRSAVALGQSLPEAIDSVAAAEKSQWLLWDSTHPRNVTRVYQQLEWQ
jgi:quinoprotein relay system zinc metallohydrolase 2